MGSITVRGVNKSYGTTHVVKDLTLEISSGSFTSILGPSGCGKTTLLRMLAGFLQPDSGQIELDGSVLSSPTRSVPPEKRGMGMVFQQYAIWPHMDVFHNVAFGLEMAKVPRGEIGPRVEAALATVGLSGLQSRGSGELSGGQQQRLALARALVTRPQVLLLDEPLSNLDARLREHMRFELRELQQATGITFVYVTHDQVEAMSMSDSIAIMREGVVAQFGTPEELYRNPASNYVVDFLGLTNWFTGRVVGIVDGMAEVALDSGPRLCGTAGPGVTAGAAVSVAVRPEDFRVAGVESENVISGVIRESLFMGSHVQHYLDLPGRDDQVVIQTGRAVRPGRGAETRWYAEPSLTRVLSATEPERQAA